MAGVTAVKWMAVGWMEEVTAGKWMAGVMAGKWMAGVMEVIPLRPR
ncbi:hypothetical protein [Archangium sp.]